jgi:hypothetical protein
VTDARGRGRAAILFLFLLLGLHWRPILLPWALAPADAVFVTPFFAGAAPPDFHGPANELLFDQTYQFVPWRAFAHASLRRGELPLWNPQSLAGTPLAATLGAAVFYPLNLALTALPFPRTLVWSAVVRLWIAGFSTYCLATRHGLGFAAALLAGTGFMLSGYLTVWLGHPHTNVAVLLPLLCLLSERLVAADSPRARARATGLLALAIGVQFTGGHAESSVHALAATGAFHLLRGRQRRAPLAALVVLPVAATVLGAALAAVQLLPFLEWLPLSAEYARRTAAPFRLLDPRALQQLATLPLALFPNVYGNPAWQTPYRSFLPWGNYNENVLYVGVVTLALAVVGIARCRQEGPVRTWAWLALVAAGMAFRLPVVGWLHELPGLALARPERLRMVLALALPLLAGFGLEAVVGARRGARRSFARLLAAVVLAGGALAVAAVTILPALRPALVAWGRALAAARWAALSAPSHPLAFYQAEVERLADTLAATLHPSDIALYAPALVAVGGLAALRLVRHGGTLAAALVALAIVDGVAAGWRFNPALPVRDLYPATPLAARLAGAHDRTTALREDLVPDAHLPLGLSDVRGLDFPTRWYDAYLSLVPERLPWIGYGVLFSGVESPLLRVLNLRWVVSARPAELERAGLRLVASEGGVHLAELDAVQPRSFLVHEAVAAHDDGEAARLLTSAPEAVYRRVILSAGPTPPPAVDSDPDPGASVAAEAATPRRTAWRVRTTRAAWLVSTDAYYPGWQVQVDGSPAALWRANLAFRAVRVPAGEHLIVFCYDPPSVRAGFILGAGAALGIAALLLPLRRRVSGRAGA